MTANGYLSVKNWDKFQQYKDGRPMWFIRVDTAVLDDYKIDQLTEIQQNHLMRIWLLAGRSSNKITNDPDWITRKIGAKSKVDVSYFIKTGFLVPYDPVRNGTMSYDDPKSLALDKIREDNIIEDNNKKNKPKKKTTKKKTTRKLKQKRFREFYDPYPVHKACKAAENVWHRKQLDSMTDEIIAHVKHMMENDEQWMQGFVPHPSTYLNGERWNDRPSKQTGNGTGNGTVQTDSPSDRHKKALERKHGSNNGAIVGEATVVVRETMGS